MKGTKSLDKGFIIVLDHLRDGFCVTRALALDVLQRDLGQPSVLGFFSGFGSCPDIGHRLVNGFLLLIRVGVREFNISKVMGFQIAVNSNGGGTFGGGLESFLELLRDAAEARPTFVGSPFGGGLARRRGLGHGGWGQKAGNKSNSTVRQRKRRASKPVMMNEVVRLVPN